MSGKGQVYINEVTEHLTQAMFHRAKAIEILKRMADVGDVSDTSILIATVLHIEWERAIKANSLEDFAKKLGVTVMTLKGVADLEGFEALKAQFERGGK